MTIWPENIVADRHEKTGKWCLQYLTDEQAEKCMHALRPSYSVGVRIPRRAHEIKEIEKLTIGDEIIASSTQEAHRLCVYIRRVFGTGSAARRAVNGRYQVMRIK